MTIKTKLSISLWILLVPGSLQGEAQSFAYDALGRLISTYRSSGPLAGIVSRSSYDPAGNRAAYVSEMAAFRLNSGGTRSSPDGRFLLAMQADGNLVLYQGTTPLWATGTSGSSYYAQLQADGNFVVYTASDVPVWASGSSGNPGSYLSIQNDGNMNILNQTGQAVWSSNTCCH